MSGTRATEQRIAAVVARRWAADGYDAAVDANALVLELAAEVERIADERAAEALDQAMLEDRTTVAKLSPVERLTCFLVKGEDLVVRAASLRAGAGSC